MRQYFWSVFSYFRLFFLEEGEGSSMLSWLVYDLYFHNLLLQFIVELIATIVNIFDGLPLNSFTPQAVCLSVVVSVRVLAIWTSTSFVGHNLNLFGGGSVDAVSSSIWLSSISDCESSRNYVAMSIGSYLHSSCLKAFSTLLVSNDWMV